MRSGDEIQHLVDFRSKVRGIALRILKTREPSEVRKAAEDLMEACDFVRNEVAPALGVQINDSKDGKPSSWHFNS